MAFVNAAQSLDVAFGGTGDAVSAFIIHGAMGVTYNQTLYYSLIALTCQALCAPFMILITRRYYRSYPGDPFWTKFLVGWVAFGTACSMIITIAETAFLRQHKFSMAGYIEGELIIMHFLYASISVGRTGLQAFFSHRCWILYDRNRFLLAALIFINIADFGFHLFVTITSMTWFPEPGWGLLAAKDISKTVPSLIEYGAKVKPMFYVLDVFSVFDESLITVLIMINLVRKKTGWKQTDSLITKLILFIMESMLPPSACNWMNLGLALSGYGIGSINKTFAMLQNILYLWAIVYALNSRSALKNTATTLMGRGGTDHDGGTKSKLGKSLHLGVPGGTKSQHTREDSEGKIMTLRSLVEDGNGNTEIRLERIQRDDIVSEDHMMANLSSKDLLPRHNVVITTDTEVYRDDKSLRGELDDRKASTTDVSFLPYHR